MVDRTFADDAIANASSLARHVGEMREANRVAFGHLFAGEIFAHGDVPALVNVVLTSPKRMSIRLKRNAETEKYTEKIYNYMI